MCLFFLWLRPIAAGHSHLANGAYFIKIRAIVRCCFNMLFSNSEIAEFKKKIISRITLFIKSYTCMIHCIHDHIFLIHTHVKRLLSFVPFFTTFYVFAMSKFGTEAAVKASAINRSMN
jgi:hypothetical protein